VAEQANDRKQASLGAATPAHPATLQSRINKQSSKTISRQREVPAAGLGRDQDFPGIVLEAGMTGVTPSGEPG
jgi:hypothetical protein